jgi:hypothetical protein
MFQSLARGGAGAGAAKVSATGPGAYQPKSAAMLAGNPAAVAGKLGTGANKNPELVKAAQSFIKSGAELTPLQRSSFTGILGGTDKAPPGGVPQPAPQPSQAVKASGTGVAPQAPPPPINEMERSADAAGIQRMATGGVVTKPTVAMIGERGPEQVTPVQQAAPPAATGTVPAAAPTGPATTAAPNAPAPAAPAPGAAVPGGAPAPGVQAPAAPIGTPETATSQPLADSPWAYEKKWGALGALGDEGVDAAVKAQTLANMKDSPFGEAARGVEKGRIFEEGMLSAKGAEQQMKADLARRGITGPAAAQMIAEGNMAARAGISQQQRKSMMDMTREEAGYKLQATAQGQALSAELAKRGVDIETLRMNREQLAQQIKQQQRGGGGGGGGQMLELMNPDGTVSQVPMEIAMMTFDLLEGGYE